MKREIKFRAKAIYSAMMWGREVNEQNLIVAIAK